MKDIIISLFDRTGNWSRPWYEAGYAVYQIDIQNGIQTDIMTWQYRHIPKDKVYCPCCRPLYRFRVQWRRVVSPQRQRRSHKEELRPCQENYGDYQLL